MNITRDNHYVPRWYLNRFVEDGGTGLYCLDLDKLGKCRPDGSPIPVREPRSQSVKSLFVEKDLYTTFFGIHLSDEIERRLFGPIDDQGRDAVLGFAKGDHREVSRHFQLFFRYLNAQVLRTPKGLSWLAGQYNELTRNDRLIEMQRFLTAYCTMWVESVVEIVSAEQSKVKFLVTDAPVTFYNAACPPESEVCTFPNDPLVELIGTQTLFPLGPEHLLILSHLEYAKPAGGKPNLTSPRQNARYHGNAVGRTDSIIRGRALTTAEVVAVNAVLKARARRYVAAGKPAWLHPERSYTGTWRDVAPILLPKKNELWRHGGEMYFGYEDGTSDYRDPFGRTSRAHELLKKKPAPANLPGDAPCGCASGHRFETCCALLPEADRPAWDVRSIRERNHFLCRKIEEILGLSKGKSWRDVQREVTEAQVSEIHQVYAMLWPGDTDLAALLPRPNPAVHRGVLFGTLDARALSETVAAPLDCFDELVLPHPFMHHEFISPEFSPVANAGQHKVMLLRNAYVLLELEPLIYRGVVHLIPDLSEFNPHYRGVMMELAKERAVGWQPSKEEMAEFTWMLRDDFLRAHLMLPPDSLRRTAKKAMPGSTDAELDAVVVELKRMQEDDPLNLLQPTVPGEQGGHLLMTKGFNLESALFFGGLVGGSLYCDNRANWSLLRHALGAGTAAKFDSVDERLHNVRLPVRLSLHDADSGRENDAALRQCFRALHGEGDVVAWFEQLLPDALQCAAGAMKSMQDVDTGMAELQVIVEADGLIPIDAQRLQLQFARRGRVSQTRVAVMIRCVGDAPDEAEGVEAGEAAEKPAN